MFTGIITQTAAVRRYTPAPDGLLATFARPQGWHDMVLGESIATDGVCLTVAALRENEYDCFLMTETLNKTTFKAHPPQRVNLERPLGVSDRFGGHFVQGHVDGVGTVRSINATDGYVMSVEFAPENRELVMYKGSICLNGVSLTVAGVTKNSFTVALIPHTLESTTLSELRAGDQLNLEFDMLGKYIANIMEARRPDAKS